MAVALVTGGSRGIGAATCRRLATAGFDVVVGFVQDAGAADTVVAEVESLGRRAISKRVDVVDEGSLDAFVAAGAALGPITAVVANAGVARAVGSLVDNALDDIRADLDVNLLGVVATCRAALPAMADGGAIVVVSSVAARLGSPGTYVHYAAAKAGVEAFAHGLALEVAGRGIRVNAVAPGTTWTGFHRDPQRPATVAASVPLGRAGRPDEIAAAIAWLLGPDASYATGSVLEVSGGL
ncbi:SDR family NAD(P)-dependent oxidoreductase [Agrococcus sp. SGAir0287]|uniref:SDR family NAD(P)-dependent oxidoreductase n=1 Tax=Agrococcus sp. SGAir0287 TaxID=2070347 RepID=UPI0010CCC8E8|nr:SDR family oxidoreductase [Agrococcus sp. SGAir0287]QCR18941.1 oxidoreductase [Agrococcus sp. SGAir0287]